MTEEIQHIFEDAKNESLTQSERASMRNMLQLFLHEHPARAPLVLRLTDACADFFERLERAPLARARGVLSAACALVLVVGVGTSYAAEGALPGDPLYAVKIYVNEMVQGSFARTEAAKAEWNTELVTRRLEEAEQLALAGKLTPAVREELQSAIAVNTADFNARVAKLADADNETVVAEINSSLEATLTGHEEVLAAIAAEKEPAVGPILAAVSVQKNAVTERRLFAEARVEDRGNTKVAAEATRKNARDAIKQANAKIAAAKTKTPSFSAQTLRAAEDRAADGEAKLDAGAYGEAYKTLQSAARTAEQAEVHAGAESHFSDEITATFMTMLAMPPATTTATTTVATSTSASSTNPTE